MVIYNQYVAFFDFTFHRTTSSIYYGNIGEDYFWLNAYTLKVVFDNLKTAMDISVEENGTANYQYILENYALLKGFSVEQVRQIFMQCYNS
ncbi:MAG: hypothetical protein K8S16_15205 [Bacteroidales bacterium]|nr:hypothetical protein [Bacteroidales bacterium]